MKFMNGGDILFVLIFIVTILVVSFIIYSQNGALVSKHQFKSYWLLFTACVVLMAYFFEPKSFIDWDLVRLFKHVDNIRHNGLTDALKYTEYRELYVWKYWMYFVAMTNNNALLHSVPLLIDFSIFGYIILDLMKEGANRVATISFTIYLWITTMGLKLAITDIRCVCAMNICFLAFYLEYIREKKKTFCLLYIVALYIHHYVVLFLILRLFLIIEKKIKYKFLIIIGALLSQGIIFEGAIYIKNNISNEYLKSMASKVLGDWEKYEFSYYFYAREMSMKILYLAMVGVFAIGLIWAVISRQSIQPSETEKVKINSMLFLLCCFGVGFGFNYLLVERLMYIASYTFAAHYLMVSKNNKNDIIPITISPILLYIFFINDLNSFIANSLGFYYI